MSSFLNNSAEDCHGGAGAGGWGASSDDGGSGAETDAIAGAGSEASVRLPRLLAHLRESWSTWVWGRVHNIKMMGPTRYVYAHEDALGLAMPISAAEYEELSDTERTATARFGRFRGAARSTDASGRLTDTVYVFDARGAKQPVLCRGNIGRSALQFGNWPRQTVVPPVPIEGHYIAGIAHPPRDGSNIHVMSQWHRMSDQFYHLWDAVVNGAELVPAELDCRRDVEETLPAWILRQRRWSVNNLELGARCAEYRHTYHTLAGLVLDYDCPADKTDAVLRDTLVRLFDDE